MFELWGEKIRVALADLDWISRAAGITVPVAVTDAGKDKTYPSARAPSDDPYPNTPWNMAPQEGEACIAFVTAPKFPTSTKNHARYMDVQTELSVVVWFDRRKITFAADPENAGLDMEVAMAIRSTVQALNLSTTGLTVHRIDFRGIETNANTIWRPLGLADDKWQLFQMPYQTFALTFRVWARMVYSCFSGTLEMAECEPC